MDPLVEIPISAWDRVRDALRENWPEHLVAYMLINTQLKYPGILTYSQWKIYCPFGDISNGVIAISDKEEFRQVLFAPLNGNMSIMENSLKSTKLINWNKPFAVPALSAHLMKCFESVCYNFNVELNDDEKVNVHFLDKETTKFQNVSPPPGTYVGPLTPEHLDVIDQKWKYTSDWSRPFFEASMKNGLTYVLYSSEDEPLAWVTIASEGVFTHLYCMEEHRRKKYAEFIIKYAVNDQLDANNDILVYTVDHNLKPQKLFTKLGFRNLGYAYWIFVSPK